MGSETSKLHQKESSKDITCGLITLSDSRKSEKLENILQKKLNQDTH